MGGSSHKLKWAQLGFEPRALRPRASSLLPCRALSPHPSGLCPFAASLVVAEGPRAFFHALCLRPWLPWEPALLCMPGVSARLVASQGTPWGGNGPQATMVPTHCGEERQRGAQLACKSGRASWWRGLPS